MELNELIEIIEIDSPEGLTFFEQFAALAECEEEIPYDTVFLLFSGANPDSLEELTEGYFHDILDKIPDDQVEFHALMSAISLNLTGLAALRLKNPDGENHLILYTDEFYRFRQWYKKDGNVICTSKSTMEASETTIFEALVLYRMEDLGGEEYDYDFSECMDYPLDEYIFPVDAFDGDTEDDDL
ncbi:hypothetical protein FACS1894127_2110 [Clostridia bacterium]|nr:hypothetical protein FACS1894127_2110 [Clostridia bacterium]